MDIVRRIKALRLVESGGGGIRLASSDVIDIPELLLTSVFIRREQVEKEFITCLKTLPQFIICAMIGSDLSVSSFIELLLSKRF